MNDKLIKTECFLYCYNKQLFTEDILNNEETINLISLGEDIYRIENINRCNRIYLESIVLGKINLENLYKCVPSSEEELWTHIYIIRDIIQQLHDNFKVLTTHT